MDSNSEAPQKSYAVIFLDFDGVLNSEGSFVYEHNRRKRYKEQGVSGPVMETLCNVCTANFQELLFQYPEAKIVISSTWREHFSLDWLREKLASYKIDSKRVIDRTPSDWGGNRGLEIQLWLNAHPEVDHYIVIDDNDWGIIDVHGKNRFIQTEWEGGGFQTKHLKEAIHKLSSKYKKLLKEAEEEARQKKAASEGGQEGT
jgi:hypothetical protein